MKPAFFSVQFFIKIIFLTRSKFQKERKTMTQKSVKATSTRNSPFVSVNLGLLLTFGKVNNSGQFPILELKCMLVFGSVPFVKVNILDNYFWHASSKFSMAIMIDFFFVPYPKWKSTLDFFVLFILPIWRQGRFLEITSQHCCFLPDLWICFLSLTSSWIGSRP